jgi:hypothetical protein
MGAEERRALAAGVRRVAAGARGLAALAARGVGPKTAGSVARRAEAAAEKGERVRGRPKFSQAELLAMYHKRMAVPEGYVPARRVVYMLQRARANT